MFGLFFVFLALSASCFGHCQMPCGIYNDQMIYDKVHEYCLTAYKATKSLENSKFETPEERNQFVRWVMTKDHESDNIAHLLTTYFLQQKIAPTPENVELVQSLHKLLFLLVAIKQHVDPKMIEEFSAEWAKFKELFHPDLPCSSHHTHPDVLAPNPKNP